MQDSQIQLEPEMENPMNSKLEQLFKACDTKGTGYIGSDDLRDICVGMGISPTDSDTLFTDLDHDKDGRINFNDFVKGFSEFVANPQMSSENQKCPAEIPIPTPNNTATGRDNYGIDRISGRYFRNQTKQQSQSPPDTWKDFVEQFSNNSSNNLSSDKLEELQGIIQNISNSPQLAKCFEDIVKTLLQDVQRLQQDNERLETVYKTEKEKHEKHLQEIEEEIDSHVSKVEAKIKVQMREEAEEERKALKLKMDEEMHDLQTHLKLFQTFENIMKKDHGDDEQMKKVKSKLEEACVENRKLKMSLTDTKTNIALMQSELAQLRAQYEEKCLELHSERESAYDYLHEQNHFSKQLHLLQEANKRLQDVNDSIWTVMETNNNSNSMPSKQLHHAPSTTGPNRSLCKRGSIIGDYLQEERPISTTRVPELPLNKSQQAKTLLSPTETEVDSLYESMNDRSPQMISPRQMGRGDIGEEELNFGMKRFMEDLTKLVQKENSLSTVREQKMSEEILVTPRSSYDTHVVDHTQQQDDVFEEIELDNPGTEWAVLPVAQTITPLSRNSRKSGYVRHQTLGRSHFRQLTANNQLGRLASNTSLDGFEPTGPPDRMYKVVFAGDAAVGKTTFIFRLSKGVFVPTLTSTLGVDFHVKTLRVDEKNVTLQLWDTAGQERFRSVTKSYFRRADGVMLLYDCTSEHSFLHVREWMELIDTFYEDDPETAAVWSNKAKRLIQVFSNYCNQPDYHRAVNIIFHAHEWQHRLVANLVKEHKEVSEKRVPVMLCANKTDLRETAFLQGKSIVGTEDGERLAREFSAIFIETSAKSGRNMVDALIQLTREMASNEDWEVQTSGMRIADSHLPKRNGVCCKQ